MVAGQSNNHKIGFIIQARMNSTRLPGKVLLPLPLHGGTPMIDWIIRQVKSLNLEQDFNVVVATSHQKSDDPLVAHLKKKRLAVYRGDEEDVLSRFINVIKEHNFDNIVRLTGDNPLLATGVFQRVINHHLKSDNEYTGTTGLPLGMNIEVINAKALASLDDKHLTRSDREHVTNYIRQNDGFRKESLAIESGVMLETYRFTVDYPVDYAMLSTVLTFYDEPNRTGTDLIQFIAENHPWVLTINSNIIQKRQFKNNNDEVDAAVELLRRSDMKFAAEVLERYGK